jgi:hypothetical protein
MSLACELTEASLWMMDGSIRMAERESLLRKRDACGVR